MIRKQILRGQRFNARVAVVLLASLMLACSSLRPRPKLTRHITLEVVGTVSDPEAVVKRAKQVLESRLNSVGIAGYKIDPQVRRRTPGLLLVFQMLPIASV